MRRLLPWALLLASLSANLAMAVGAVRRREPVPAIEPQLMTRLALDPDQRASIEHLRSNLMASRHEHVRVMAELRQRLTAAMARQSDDPAAVTRALRDLADAQAAYQCQVVDHVLSVRSVLRADQRPRFERMISEQMGAGAPTCECLQAPREGGVP